MRDIDTPVTHSEWEPDDDRQERAEQAARSADLANAVYERARLADERVSQHLDGTYKPTGARRGRMRRNVR